jgi:hypothetical protein
MPWLSLSLAGLSLKRPRFTTRSVHVGFVVDKVALRLVPLRTLQISPVSIITSKFHAHIRIIWGINNRPTGGPSFGTATLMRREGLCASMIPKAMPTEALAPDRGTHVGKAKGRDQTKAAAGMSGR